MKRWVERILKRPKPLQPLETPRPRFRWLEVVKRVVPAWLKPRPPA